MSKYVIKIGNKYLTPYGSLTSDVCCADKFKYREDAEDMADANNGEVEAIDDKRND